MITHLLDFALFVVAVVISCAVVLTTLHVVDKELPQLTSNQTTER